MDTAQFLASIWPEQGHYVIGTYPHPNKREPGGAPVWWHRPFSDIGHAAKYAAQESQKYDVYQAMHSMLEVTKNEHGYLKVARTAANAAWVRTFYIDLDVQKPGEPRDENVYLTLAAAHVGLKEFCMTVGLPRPMIILSGRGLHVYWRLDRDVPSKEWLPHAEKLKRLAIYHGLLIDRKVPADCARVLRPVGTLNRKDPNNLLPVNLGKLAGEYSFDTIVAILDRACTLLPDPRDMIEMKSDGLAPPTPKRLAEVCPSFVEMLRTAPVAKEPVWKLTIELLRHTSGGDKAAHKASHPHPEYSFEETQAKLDYLRERDMGPPRCERVERDMPDNRCAVCPNRGKPTSSAIVFARRKAEPLPVEIPEPQRPFARTKRGIEYQPTPTESNPDPLAVVIYDYDFYPVEIVDDAIRREKRVEWVAHVPIRGEIRVSMPIDAYTNEDKLISTLVHQGVTADKRNAKHLGAYVSHYIKLLQAAVAERQQFANFGFTEKYDRFVLDGYAITAAGPTPVVLSPAVANAARSIGKAGTLAGQKAAMRFYESPVYARQQFAICMALAAPLFYMTGHHGLILNLSGPSGASKTSAMATGAAFWGNPEKYILNGTISGFTTNARLARLETMASLPIMLDEVTNVPAEVIKEMAMAVTQAGGRGRLDRAGVEKVMPDNVKSTIMWTSSNNSMHGLLAQNNQAGDAGSFRVVELNVVRQTVHTKAEADAFLREIMSNYGHIGPIFIEHVMANREAVLALLRRLTAEVDFKGNIAPPERFWSTGIVLACLGATLAKELGLFDYDPEHMMRWAIDEQLPEMRGILKDHYQDPAQTLQTFMLSIANNLLVVAGRDAKGMSVLRGPRGSAVEGRLEIESRRLWVPCHVVRAWCEKRGLSFDAMTRDLVKANVIAKEKMNPARYLPDWAGALTTCIRIDLDHELMAGAPPIETTEGAQILNFPGASPQRDAKGVARGL